ncbi:MAG: outer membrane beta-barrel protein [Pseudomonadota bacterium]
MKLRSPALLALVLASTPAAEAEDSGWYVRAIAGYNTLSDETVRHSTGEFAGEASFGSGFAGGGAVGYDTGPWRFEGEILYRSADLDRLEAATGPITEGNYASLGFGANVLYSFNLFGTDRATSYVGGGLVFLQEIDIDFETPEENSFSGDEFGYQLILGAEYDFGARWSGFAEYRWFDAGDPDLDAEGDALGTVNVDYANQALLFGVRYDF